MSTFKSLSSRLNLPVSKHKRFSVTLFLNILTVVIIFIDKLTVTQLLALASPSYDLYIPKDYTNTDLICVLPVAVDFPEVRTPLYD